MRAPRVVLAVAFVLLALLSPRAYAQGEDLFKTLKVDASVVVRKHSTGADMVTITVLAPNYPPVELQARIDEIGTELGSPSRGVEVHPYTNGSAASSASPFLQASFATNGILNGDAGIHLAPIVRAFAGGFGASLVQGIEVHIEGAKPTNMTLTEFESSAVRVQSRAEPSPPAIVYRVLLKTQDPKLIMVPDKAELPATPLNREQGTSGSSPTLIWVLVIIGTLAAGALVYNLALRGSSRTHRR